MTSEQEVDELQQQVAALVRDNRSLMSRLNDLEDRVASHGGIDSGAAGQNYPHPNQSVATLDFGNHNNIVVGRLNEYGLLFQNDQSVIGAVGIVDSLDRPIPAGGLLALVPFAGLYGSINAIGDIVLGLRLQHDATNPFTQPYMDFNFHAGYNSTATAIYEINQGSAGTAGNGTVGLALYANWGAVDLHTGNTQVIIPKATADPASFMSTGGTWIWSRSDTVKLRWRNSSSVADNVAMEAWVTALAAPLSSAFVTIGSDATLSSERALTAGAGITITDGGAGSTVTVLVTDGSITYAKLQDISTTQRVLGRNTAGAGDAEEVSASSVLDWIGTTRGAVFYRGAAGWAILAPGTSGYVLQANGAGADPTWVAAAASGWAPITTAKTGAYTAVKNDVVLANGTFTVDLTAAATVANGGIIVVKNTGTGVITVDANASETIDGALTRTLTVQYESITLVSDGTNWSII